MARLIGRTVGRHGSFLLQRQQVHEDGRFRGGIGRFRFSPATSRGAACGAAAGSSGARESAGTSPSGTRSGVR
jgi:hypothetical protein